LVGLRFELRALHLQSRHSTTSVIQSCLQSILLWLYEDGGLTNYLPSWLQTAILPISASQEARITGVNHIFCKLTISSLWFLDSEKSISMLSDRGLWVEVAKTSLIDRFLKTTLFSFPNYFLHMSQLFFSDCFHLFLFAACQTDITCNLKNQF
jgi:hypothetical protein